MTSHERTAIEKAQKALREIAELDKSEGKEGSMGYAHALGRANGLARAVLPYVDSILKASS